LAASGDATVTGGLHRRSSQIITRCGLCRQCAIVEHFRPLEGVRSEAGAPERRRPRLVCWCERSTIALFRELTASGRQIVAIVEQSRRREDVLRLRASLVAARMMVLDSLSSSAAKRCFTLVSGAGIGMDRVRDRRHRKRDAMAWPLVPNDAHRCSHCATDISATSCLERCRILTATPSSVQQLPWPRDTIRSRHPPSRPRWRRFPHEPHVLAGLLDGLIFVADDDARRVAQDALGHRSFVVRRAAAQALQQMERHPETTCERRERFHTSTNVVPAASKSSMRVPRRSRIALMRPNAWLRGTRGVPSGRTVRRRQTS
jgi:hypothetical protein